MLSLLRRTSPTIRTSEACICCMASIISATSPRPVTCTGRDKSPSPIRRATPLTSLSDWRMRATSTHDSSTSNASPATPATTTAMRYERISALASAAWASERSIW